jgi:O-antigen/teichoic acid export membrane protein
MLDAFRLMLIFALLDPIKVTIAGVLTAVGKPEKVTLVRTIQLLVLVIGLFVLGYRFDIAGVALALDVMLVVGIGLLLYQVKPYVDFSARRLFTAPLIALGIGFGLSWLVTYVWDIYNSDWVSVIVLSLSFGAGYLISLYLLEGKVLYQSFVELVEIPVWAERFKAFFNF